MWNFPANVPGKMLFYCFCPAAIGSEKLIKTGFLGGKIHCKHFTNTVRDAEEMAFYMLYFSSGTMSVDIRTGGCLGKCYIC